MRTLLCPILLALGIAAAGPALAQNSYPSKPVRIIVGAAPGGPTDLVARLLGEKLSQSTGVPFIVENRGGGGGVIASETVARAEPDGYTILMGSVSTHGINPALYRKLNYDALADFEPITQVVSYPLVLIVNPATVPATNMAEFLSYVRKHPGKVNRGSAGNGTSMHIAGELFNSLAGTRMTHVPYRGSAPAVAALLAGQIDVDFESIPVAMPHVESGKLRALAVTSAKRFESMPDIPTVAETLPGYAFTGWLGLLAPAGTPKAVIEILHRKTAAALQDTDVKEKLLAQVMQPVGDTPESFGRFIRSEIDKLGAVVRESGATVD